MSKEQSGERSARIAYCFADCGVEAEALATVGEVHRFTIDPRPNEWVAETTQMDLAEALPPGGYDLAVLHPPCTAWSDMPDVDTESAPRLIDRAREIGREIADEYVIENKPRAPLENPTLLDGKMFGLPIRYERAFETSFRMRQPPRQQTLGTETSPFFYSERSPVWWRVVKGVRGDYPKEHLAKNALPLPYVDYIAREWLCATGRAQGVADYSDYDAEMDERRARETNTQLHDHA